MGQVFLKHLVFFTACSNPLKRCCPSYRWKRMWVIYLVMQSVSSTSVWAQVTESQMLCSFSLPLELKRSLRHPLVRFSYHLYKSVKNISRTVIILSKKNQNKGPRRNFKDHPVEFSDLQMAKWSPREDRGLGHHLLYQLELYDPSPSDPPTVSTQSSPQIPWPCAQSGPCWALWPHITQRLLSLLLLQPCDAALPVSPPSPFQWPFPTPPG